MSHRRLWNACAVATAVLVLAAAGCAPAHDGAGREWAQRLELDFAEPDMPALPAPAPAGEPDDGEEDYGEFGEFRPEPQGYVNPANIYDPDEVIAVPYFGDKFTVSFSGLKILTYGKELLDGVSKEDVRYSRIREESHDEDGTLLGRLRYLFVQITATNDSDDERVEIGINMPGPILLDNDFNIVANYWGDARYACEVGSVPASREGYLYFHVFLDPHESKTYVVGYMVDDGVYTEGNPELERILGDAETLDEAAPQLYTRYFLAELFYRTGGPAYPNYKAFRIDFPAEAQARRG